MERLARALAAETEADEEAVSNTEALEAAGDEALSEATLAAIAGLGGESAAALRAQLAFAQRMEEIADKWRSLPDERVKKLLAWINENMCPGLSSARPGAPRQWNGRRLLIFTEYEATRRYLQGLLEHAVVPTDRGESRIRTFTGSTPLHIREEIKHAFNADPDEEPLRILIATDAAREGLNLQRHCYDLFHFDLPWNPSRIEQRNGRIDRKLQPAPEVFCRYFFYVQRPEDRVLQALVRKTETIRTELGSLAQVLEGRLAETLKGGIRRRDVEATRQKIESAELDGRRATVDRELEETRERQDAIKDQIDRLRNQLARSRNAIGVDAGQLRRTISLALRLNGAPALERTDDDRLDRPVETFRFPGDSRSLAADPRWSGTLDTLRERKERDEELGQWRRRARIRPVTFEDPGVLGDKAVHLHLEHRVVQRLLGRFSAQGLIHHDLSRACLAVAPDAVPRVALLGRLAIYGPGAARLHEEIVPITARWIEPTRRQGPLRPYAREAETVTLTVLEAAFDEAHKHRVPGEVARRLRENAATDIADLMPHLEARGGAARADAEKALGERARRESTAMRKLLEDQKKRIAAALGQDDQQFTLNFDEAERRQRQAERNAWDRRMTKLDRELHDEPRRIEEGYETKAWRLEPVGLVYLWPVTG